MFHHIVPSICPQQHDRIAYDRQPRRYFRIKFSNIFLFSNRNFYKIIQIVLNPPYIIWWSITCTGRICNFFSYCFERKQECQFKIINIRIQHLIASRNNCTVFVFCYIFLHWLYCRKMLCQLKIFLAESCKSSMFFSDAVCKR